MIDPVLLAGIDQLSLPETVAAPLNAYINEVKIFNPLYGLVATTENFAVRHVLDSLAPWKLLADRCGDCAHIADIGSGAGLPGIPLAIVLASYSFVLIERSSRRAAFLHHTINALRLDNVTVYEGEMESYALPQFDCVVFRAFHPLEKKLVRKLFRLVKIGGFIGAYKGKAQAIHSELSALKGEIGMCELLDVAVPFLSESRHLVTLTHA
ncbi:MAG: 16S rRNA (guanine(527)-N(7))-methyltransferase RsmG [Treponema sp.]|jgi:16S rRNA (guanine527-N7)-methyltransferase|nr:16S rRNA (guanine(527)-N(7))-methyltransferase RsmG [Treponema sp.]